MLKSELLSHVDYSSMMNATNPQNITDKEHIDAMLALLVTENTPKVLSDEELIEKVKNLKYTEETTPENKQLLEDRLLRLAQLPTGKKLLSMLPDGVTFGTDYQEHEADATYNRYTHRIYLNLGSHRFVSQQCADIGHEIRHAIQHKYDPSFTRETSFEFEKMLELDGRLQNRQLEAEYLNEFRDESEEYRGLERTHREYFKEYYQYTDYLKNEPNVSDETKQKIINTLYAIDTWYGITDNDWKDSYDYNCYRIKGCYTEMAMYSFEHPEENEDRSQLDRQIKQSYAENMNIGLPPEFFDKYQDCTVVVDGHKLFERKVDEYGSTITMFFANGNPSYQAELTNPNHDKKRYETYFYEDGLKRSEYSYEHPNYGYRCGDFTKYYDTISEKTGDQRIREKGCYFRDGNSGGIVYSNDDEPISIERHEYRKNGRLSLLHILSGANEGKITYFYDKTGNKQSSGTVDMFGKANGYFETYRDDPTNSLEWVGNQKNIYRDGLCKKYYPSKNVAAEALFDDGIEIKSTEYKDEKPDKNGEPKKESEYFYDRETGWKYCNFFDENGICYKKCKYYNNGNIEREWYCAGEKKGQCTVFYDNPTHTIKFSMTADENGIGQGFFKRYTPDGFLELAGYQKDGDFEGPYKKYNVQGKVIEQGIIKDKTCIPDEKYSKKETISYHPQNQSDKKLSVADVASIARKDRL